MKAKVPPLPRLASPGYGSRLGKDFPSGRFPLVSSLAMKTLNRFLLVALAVTLLAATYAMQTGMTQVNFGHATFYAIKWPWLHEVREICIFAVLGWCLLFTQREPVFVRIGLIALILTFVIMNLSPHFAKELPTPPNWH
jgi:hypothetical protein